MKTAQEEDKERSDRESNEIREMVRAFERCTLPINDFKHREHLGVALFYLTQMPVCEAAHQFRVSIKRFIAHYRETGYNETITMFWLGVIVSFLMKAEAARPLSELLGELLESCHDSRLIYSYYSKERLLSDDAKTTWVAPDLRPLDF